jgi:hypothetical protein
MVSGLTAALLLARGRAEGLRLLGTDMAAAAASFRAAIICLPLFIGLRLIGWALNGAPPRGVALALVAEVAGFALTWAGYALASKVLAGQARCDARWPHFIAAWNWVNVVQYVLLVPFMLPGVLGAPDWLANGLGLVLLGYAVWLEWFVARVALGVSGPAAVLFVLLDLALGLLIGAGVARVSGG